MPLVIKDKIYPIFKDLSANELLEKCLHGQTQNANEALNGMIWQHCPKTQFVCRQTLEMCVASAVLSYNDSAGDVRNVLKELKVDPGSFCTQSVRKTDLKRIKSIEQKSSEKDKKARKKRRAIRKGFLDKEAEEEGETYCSGAY